MSRQRYLFLGTLLQESSANFGGRDDDENWVDAPLCLDGKGRYTLRGEGQAGALLAMARKLFKDIPADYLGGCTARTPSVWRTYTSHPEQDDKSLAELRQCVRIDAQTGAADDGALFDLETLPRGVSWPFLLELDLSAVSATQKQRILAITVRALQALGGWLLLAGQRSCSRPRLVPVGSSQGLAFAAGGCLAQCFCRLPARLCTATGRAGNR